MWSGCLPTMTTTSELRKASTRDQLPIMTTDLPDWSTRGRDLRECLEAGLVTYNLVTMTSAQRK